MRVEPVYHTKTQLCRGGESNLSNESQTHVGITSQGRITEEFFIQIDLKVKSRTGQS